ncbi:MAG: hypothetical protein ACXIUB_02060 [Wenzhouxiangella sp.]
MSAKILTLAVAGLMGLSSAALADPSFSSLEERMTGREFRETGLYKLNDDELAALNRWIRQRSLAEEEPRQASSTDQVDGTAPAVSSDRRGLPTSEDRSTIESRIKGSFTGWRGRTEFELENGQVWRQAESGTFVVPEMENPEVEIIPGMFNSWRLRVSGYNTRVRVERIR